MTDHQSEATNHEEWLANLDRIGAVATKHELWCIWLNAPNREAEETRHLLTHIITNHN